MPGKDTRASPRHRRVVVIGGGGTGAAILHDLVLRGVEAVLVERGELTSGTTGRHHGQLHSGARYAVTDPEAARECIQESTILRRIAREALEFNGGLFVGVTDREAAFAGTLEEACRRCGIPARRLSGREALAAEPNLNAGVCAAVSVPDGTLDAWRLPLMFFATARRGGAEIRPFTEAVGLDLTGGRVRGVRVRDFRAGREETVAGDLVINAAGAWAGRVAALAGLNVPVAPSAGVMVAVKGRRVNTVVSRLGPPGDADIVVPQRSLSIAGTTSWFAGDPDRLQVPEDHVRTILEKCGEMVPGVAAGEVRAVWAAARPLFAEATGAGSDGRAVSRTFHCIDHEAEDGVEGLLSVVGGKATTLRAMAEKTVDLACGKLGITAPCRTREARLLSHRAYFG